MENDFPQYTRKVVETENKYCNYLEKYLKVSVKESRNTYIQKKYSYKNFAIGATLSLVGIFLGQPITFVEKLLTIATIAYTVVSGKQVLDESAEVGKDAEYSYMGAKEGYIYDSRDFIDDVKVVVNASNGTFDGGYDKYGKWTWIESPRSDAYEVDTAYIINKTITNYNECLVGYDGHCPKYLPDR